jgi:hypothetical protein
MPANGGLGVFARRWRERCVSRVSASTRSPPPTRLPAFTSGSSSGACLATRLAACTPRGDAPVLVAASVAASPFDLPARVREGRALEASVPLRSPVVLINCGRSVRVPCLALASRSSSGRNSSAITARCPASKLCGCLAHGKLVTNHHRLRCCNGDLSLVEVPALDALTHRAPARRLPGRGEGSATRTNRPWRRRKVRRHPPNAAEESDAGGYAGEPALTPAGQCQRTGVKLCYAVA